MATDTAAIMAKLDSIEAQLATLNRRIVDPDLIVTDDDLAALRRADAAHKAGTTKRLR